MAKEKILVVDDEEDILELVRFNLAREGYDIACAVSGEKALKIVRSTPVDLIVLDLMLPGMDGLEVMRKIKADSEKNQIPVIMLTAKGDESDIVTGLELGADDYITKPFSPKVLIARIRALFRRRRVDQETDINEFSVHHLAIHPGRRRVVAAGVPIDLTYSEFQILSYLARRPGWVFTRGQIVDAVRGSDYPVTDRSIDVQVVGLRKKLGSFGKYIETVRGVGYRFSENP